MKKAWEIAIAPSKQLPMNGIMMYMSGNSLQIFSIMMVFMLFKGPIQGLINTNAAFAKYETPSTRGRLVAVKLVYVLMQFLLLALGIWKVNAMGLLPYVLILGGSLLVVDTDIFGQDYEIGLARVGIREAAFGESLLCIQVICGNEVIDCSINRKAPFEFRFFGCIMIDIQTLLIAS
jgi:hypothetical protein